MLLIYLWYVKVKSMCLINTPRKHMQFHTSIPRRWLEACAQLNATPRLSVCIQRMGGSVSPRSGQDTWGKIKIFGLCQESNHSSLVVQTIVKLLYRLNNSDLNIFVCRNAHQCKICCLKTMKIFKDNCWRIIWICYLNYSTSGGLHLGVLTRAGYMVGKK